MPDKPPHVPKCDRGSSESTLRRGLQILEILANRTVTANTGLGVVAIARLLDVDKSQISRTLKVLEQTGYVDRDEETHRYRLSWKIPSMAAYAAPSPALLRASGRVLPRVAESIGMQVHLSVQQGLGALVVDATAGPDATKFVGQIVPLCTGSGRALLLDHTRDRVAALVGSSTTVAQRTVTVDEVWSSVLEGRRGGVVVSQSVMVPHLISAAAPVRDAHGRIMAVVGCVAPTSVVSPQMHVLSHRLREVSSVITARASTLEDGPRPIAELTWPDGVPASSRQSATERANPPQ